MHISELLVLSADGACILNKTFRHDVTTSTLDRFSERLRENTDGSQPPYFKVGSVTYCHIFRSDLYFLATSVAPQISIIQVLDVLNRYYELLKDFLGSVNEESIRSNLVLAFEVLDELIDFGYIQLSTTDKIKPYIQSDPVAPRGGHPATALPAPGLFGLEYHTAPSNASDKPVLHSRLEQEQRKREIFVDVIERLNVLIAANGAILRSELRGEMTMKCFLDSSSPLVKLRVNKDLIIATPELKHQGYGKTVRLDKCTFHDCVDLAEFDAKRLLIVRPPEGQFRVMSYQIDGDLSRGLPFRIVSSIVEDASPRDVELNIKLVCDVPAHCQAINVTLNIPVPKTTSSISQQLSGGSSIQPTGGSSTQSAVLVTAGQKRIEWTIPKILGSQEQLATFKLIDAKKSGEEERRGKRGGAGEGGGSGSELGPISIDFELSGYNCSNVQILDMKVSAEQQVSYTPQKWLRYITTADSYVVKLV